MHVLPSANSTPPAKTMTRHAAAGSAERRWRRTASIVVVCIGAITAGTAPLQPLLRQQLPHHCHGTSQQCRHRPRKVQRTGHGRRARVRLLLKCRTRSARRTRAHAAALDSTSCTHCSTPVSLYSIATRDPAESNSAYQQQKFIYTPSADCHNS